MRSRSKAVLLCVALSLMAPAYPQTQTVRDDEILAAVAKLKTDPNLASERKTRTLRWAHNSQDRPPAAVPGWVAWIGDLFAWLAETGRLLLWVTCCLLLALLGVYVFRYIRARAQLPLAARAAAPTHVRDLDIRPESLPDDIGAAAFALWERGEHRAALSLLYRGLLSRLAHAYSLPIRDSSTEGDCMELARRQLDSDRSAYVSRLVRVWQHCVYGGIEPNIEEVRALCGDFRL